MPGKFLYSFRSPGAAELIRESQLLMVQAPVECCSHLGFAATGKQKKLEVIGRGLPVKLQCYFI